MVVWIVHIRFVIQMHLFGRFTVASWRCAPFGNELWIVRVVHISMPAAIFGRRGIELSRAVTHVSLVRHDKVLKVIKTQIDRNVTKRINKSHLLSQMIHCKEFWIVTISERHFIVFPSMSTIGFPLVRRKLSRMIHLKHRITYHVTYIDKKQFGRAGCLTITAL